MNRTALGLLLLLAAPGASAWVSCSDPGLEAPVPLEREPPAYPDAVRATPDGYFEQAAAEGVRRWRFTPARQDGEPVECRLLTRVRFALTDEVTTVAGAVYPPALLRDHIEGYVEVEYSLDAAGYAQDARVTGAMPRGEFEQAALAAVRAWKGPASVDAPRRACRARPAA